MGSLSSGNDLALTDAGNNGVSLSIDGNGQNTSYSGVLSGSNGSLTKAGGGVLTLSNTETYTGGTTVNGGTLQLNVGGPATGIGISAAR